MKLNIQLLSLPVLVASSVVPNIIPAKHNTSDIFTFSDKRDFLGVKCNEEIKEIKDCFTYPNIDNYEQLCPTLESEKCKQLFNEPFQLVPNCQDVPFISKFFQSSYLENIKYRFELSCKKDEAGNICPFSEIELNKFSKNKTVLTVEQYNTAKQNTCQSQICREATYNYYAFAGNFTKNFDKATQLFTLPEYDSVVIDKKELADYLDSEECKLESGTSTLNISTAFFISIGLLLLSLY